jgi:hypothetical protein
MHSEGVPSLGGSAYMTLHEYRHHAAKCLQIAEGVTDFQQRSSLLNMAQSWLRLAQQAEKNLATDLSLTDLGLTGLGLTGLGPTGLGLPDLGPTDLCLPETPAPPADAGRPSVPRQQQQIQPGNEE